MRLNFKWKILFPVIVLFCMFIGVSQYFTFSNFKVISQYFIQQDLDKTVKNFNHSIEAEGEKCLYVASLISSLTIVSDAYQIGLPELSREALRNDMKFILDKFKKDTGKSNLKIHFHLPPATSLLRIWRKPGKRDGGDDLKSFRNSILYVYKHKQAVSGIELGRAGLAIRGIVPIISSVAGAGGKQYLGSVEMVSNFNRIIEKIQSNKAKIAIFLKNQYLSISRKLKKNPKIGSFTLVNKKNLNIFQNKINSNILNQGSKSKIIVNNDDNTITAAFPIKDFQGKTIAVATILYNTREAISLLKSSMNKLLTGLIIGLIVFLIILYVAISYSIKPLIFTKNVLKEIAQGEGDLTKKIPVSSKDEIGELGEYFNAFIDKLNNMLIEVKDTSEVLSSESSNVAKESEKVQNSNENILSNVETVASSIEEINAVLNSLANSTEHLSNNVEVFHKENTSLINEIENINNYASKLNAIVGEVNNASDSLKDASNTLENSSDGIKDVTEEHGTILRQIIDAIDTVKKAANNILHSIDSFASSLEEQTKSIDKVSDKADSAYKVTEESAAEVLKSKDEMDKVVARMNNIGESIKSLGDTMEELSGSVSNIEEILTLIDEISEQTNLLALNAAIEAARAGEAGKGFAVVADEVRRLAERSVDATKDIKEIINVMVKMTENAVHQSSSSVSDMINGLEMLNKAGKQLYGVADKANESKHLVKEIAVASNQQREVIHEITKSVNDVVEEAKDINMKVDDLTDASEHMRTEFEKVLEASENIAKNIGTFKENSDNLNKVSETLSSISEQTVYLAQESQSVGRIVLESIREIKEEVANIKLGTTEQVKASQLINKSMQEISELCEESITLAKNSNLRIKQVDEKSALLKHLVSGFKLKN